MAEPRFVLDSSEWESNVLTVRPRELTLILDWKIWKFPFFLQIKVCAIKASGSGKLNFYDFYIQLRGAGYEDLTMIKSEIFYCIKISKKLSKIICFMQNHELLVFYCGHQSKVHRQKWVSTNRQLIVANLIYITLPQISYCVTKCIQNGPKRCFSMYTDKKTKAISKEGCDSGQVAEFFSNL